MSADNDSAPISLEVCDASELQDGAMKEVTFGEKGKVLISKVGGKLFATSAVCTHYGAPLVKGVLTGCGRVICPWHGACFDIKTGDVEDAPGLDSLHSYTAVLSETSPQRIIVTASKRVVESKKGRTPTRARKAATETSNIATSVADDGKVVIIGGGSGGMGAIEGLRENGYKGKIVVITSEPHGPIDRTKISKTFMSDPEKLAIRSTSEYASEPWNIDLRISVNVSAIDFQNKTVMFDGGEEKYDHLIVATGASPRTLPVEGGNLEGVLKLRTVADAKMVDEAIKEGKRVVFVGSSFISMEAAIVASKRKLASLDVIGMEEFPFEAILGKEIGKGLLAHHEKQGIKFHMKCEIESFVASESDPKRVGSVKLKDGTVLPCDAVILGIGAKPNTELLKAAGVEIEKDGGIKVDEHLRIVGHSDVYAVGDIAHYPFNGGHTRIEHWNVASNHGRAAASAIAAPSEAKPFSKIPIFWSAQGAQLRYCGNGKGYDDSYIKGNAADLKFEAYYAKEGKIVAVATMGVDPLVSKSSELLRTNLMPTLEAIRGGKNPLDISLSTVAV